MNTFFKRIVFVLVALVVSIGVSNAYSKDVDGLKWKGRARSTIEGFLTGDISKFQKHINKKNYSKEFTDEMTSIFGKQPSKWKIKRTYHQPFPGYSNERWVVQVTNGEESADILLPFNDAGKIIGLFVFNAATAEELGIPNGRYIVKNEYIIPATGEWAVTQGGNRRIENHHLMDYPGRCGNAFAVDLVKLSNNRMHSGSGEKNKDYYGFGEVIIAPADGKVIEVVDGVHEGIFGVDNGFHPAGNTITIDHGKGEYSLIAHLKRDSIKVKVGDKVKKGQFIAECGNSGSSNGSVPHIHFQLQDAPFLCKADSLPITFRNICVNGKMQKKTKIEQNDLISNSCEKESDLHAMD